MSERDDLTALIAKRIKTYRAGAIARPEAAHVDRWASQFTPANQLPFLREFNHVIGQTFVTEKNVGDFLQNLITNAKLVGPDPADYWSRAHLLDIQRNGKSQEEMRKVFAARLRDSVGLDLDDCGKRGGDYIYLDDVMFSGNRVGSDLEQWIANDAPKKAKVHIIVAVLHAGGEYLAMRKLSGVVKASGKDIVIEYWRARTIENRKAYKNDSGVLWPVTVPTAPEVQAYMALPSRFPFEPRRVTGTVVAPFSSEQGRQILETEFLIAGAKIRSKSDNPKASMRPLGFSPFGVGFGSMITTYRNCPNNCPLAMWWGDPTATFGPLHWYPLLQRDTYAAQAIRDAFDVIDD
jgi:hypothetical protein